ALTVAEFDQAVRFYCDGLGLAVVRSWDADDGRGAILDAGRATLELLDERQAELIDRVEVGRRVSGPLRLALEFADAAAAAQTAREAGAQLLHEAVETPWRHRNARLVAPDGMQLTLFQRLDEEEAGDASLDAAEAALLRRAFAVSLRARERGNHPF